MSGMSPTAPAADQAVGDVSPRAAAAMAPRKWWQEKPVRFGAGILVVAAMVAPWLLLAHGTHWHLGGRDSYLDLSVRDSYWVVGLLLVPFMRAVSYRKRDLLVIGMIPIYGQYVAGLLVYRLLSLPRRDWLPRADELPLVVRLPRAGGDYVVARTWEEAEALRARWCVNPSHQHPYESWAAVPPGGCAIRAPSAAVH
jgi:hypothetical protein